MQQLLLSLVTIRESPLWAPVVAGGMLVVPFCHGGGGGGGGEGGRGIKSPRPVQIRKIFICGSLIPTGQPHTVNIILFPYRKGINTNLYVLWV